MAIPADRYKLMPLRGLKASLDAGLVDILEGELCYATDEDILYIKESGVLTPTSAGEVTEGPEGPQGPQGPEGPEGPSGANGVDGGIGPQGPAGSDGADSIVPGPEGPQGPAGPAGTNGVTSINSQVGDVSLTASDLGALVPGEVNPVYFANQAAFPDAATNHGAVAHSHADGAMFFAHGGAWNRLANASEIPSVPVNNLDVDALPLLP